MCNECYSNQPRITPILKPEKCLSNHMQYICSTCGRCICIDKDETRGLRRWNFPFKTMEIAKLYLRVAEVSTGKCCGIYEIISDKGRKSYKIFEDKETAENYLTKNKGKQYSMRIIYQTEQYREYKTLQIRKLDDSEIEKYLREQHLENKINK